MTRVKKLVRYTEDFVISRYHCTHAQPLLPPHIHHFEQLYPQFTLSMNIGTFLVGGWGAGGGGGGKTKQPREKNTPK